MFLLTIGLFLIACYLYSTRGHNYWRKRNVKHDTPLPVLGNHFKNGFGLKSFTHVLREIYNKYPDEKVVGYYRGNSPELVIRDLDLIKDVLHKDFSCFYLRGFGRYREQDPLMKNLFHADGDEWKLLRKNLTGCFTASKCKKMFPIIIKCVEKLQSVTEEKVKRGGPIDVRELMARFSSDFVGTCGFGIDTDTIYDEDSAFRKLGGKFLQRSLKDVLLYGIIGLFPELHKIITLPNLKGYNEFASIVESALKHKNYEPTVRNDFIDAVLVIQKKGKISGQSIENQNFDGTPVAIELEMDKNMLISQVFVFYVGGFETSSFALSVTLHQIAFHPNFQSKLHREIDGVLARYQTLCFDAVNEMEYLQMALKESLRMFTSLGFLQRVCSKRYTFPSLGITIDPGVTVYIPTQSIQRDEKYFENANEFRPERFAPDSDKHNKYAYLPFGDGPRNCIDRRRGRREDSHPLTMNAVKCSKRQEQKSICVVKSGEVVLF